MIELNFARDGTDVFQRTQELWTLKQTPHRVLKMSGNQIKVIEDRVAYVDILAE